MKIGKRLKNFGRYYIIAACLLSVNFAGAEIPTGLEQKALDYFCEHKSEMHEAFSRKPYRRLAFLDNTQGISGRLWKISVCIGEMKISDLPSRPDLMAQDSINGTVPDQVVYLKTPKECKSCRRADFRPYDYVGYKLYVYNAVEYKGHYYVELHIQTKELEDWTICVKFDHTEKVVDSCVSYLIY